MKNLLFIISGLALTFYTAFVGFKVYGWYYTEVGFELPQLSFLNIIALSFITSIFYNNNTLLLYIHSKNKNKAKEKRDKESAFRLFSKLVFYTLTLIFAYLFKVVLF